MEVVELDAKTLVESKEEEPRLGPPRVVCLGSARALMVKCRPCTGRGARPRTVAAGAKRYAVFTSGLMSRLQASVRFGFLGRDWQVLR